MKNAFIYAAKRTPIGSFMGSLSSVSGSQLGAKVLKALVKENSLKGSERDRAFKAPIFLGAPNSGLLFLVDVRSRGSMN